MIIFIAGRREGEGAEGVARKTARARALNHNNNNDNDNNSNKHHNK